MRNKKLTPKSFGRVMFAIQNGDKDRLAMICEKFDEALDDLLNCDGFGTEGQLDPRGDRRDD